MTWHHLPELLGNLPFLPEREADYSELPCSASVPSALWKSSRIAEKCSSDANGTVCSPCSLSGMILKTSMENPGEDWLTLYQAGFRVPTFHKSGRKQESTENTVGFGRKCLGSFAKYDPAMSSWKTPQTSCLGVSTAYSEIWPQWGFMLDGECWELPTLAPPISEDECGYLPTPVAHRQGFGGSHNCKKAKTILGRTFYYVKEVEALMGIPEEWTALEPLAICRFHEWWRQHGDCSVEKNESVEQSLADMMPGREEKQWN